MLDGYSIIKKEMLMNNLNLNYDTLRIRHLFSQELYNSYPDYEFYIEKQFYFIHLNQPYLATLYDSNTEENLISEGIVLNDDELLFASFLKLWGFTINLGEFIDKNIDKLDFDVKEAEDLFRNKSKLLKILPNYPKELLHSIEYNSVKDYLLAIRRYYNHPLTKNRAFLRSCFFLSKSDLLYVSNNLFFEDACLNIYFALDGLIHLLHEKYYPGQQFNFNNLKIVLKKLLNDNDQLFEYLGEARELRNNIVHPASRNFIFDDVFPISSAEDYLEFKDVALGFFAFLLSDNTSELIRFLDPMTYYSNKL